MSDDQKIWFIYLTDHHEGPFTAGEIAEKAKAGLVSGASLAWKDGMPEWVPAETIPELSTAMGNAAAVAEVGAADLSGVSRTNNMITKEEENSGLSLTGDTGKTGSPMAASDGEVSLAQLLANQQKGGDTSSASESGVIADSGSVLSSMMGQVQKENPVTAGSGVSIGGGAGIGGLTQQTKTGAGDPPPDEDAWTLKIGAQVSGLHSLNRLKELASAGEIPPDAMVWHPGWNDFQPVSTVASIDAARKSGSTKTGMTRSSLSRPGFVNSGMSNAAAAGNEDDEPTDTEIEAPPKGFKGILFKVQAFLKKRKKAQAKKVAAAPAKGGKVALQPAPAPGKKAGAAARTGGAVKRLVTILLILAVLGGGGFAAWHFLLSSPLPSDLDVTEEDKTAMTGVVKASAEGGVKLHLGQAIGTEDAPADPATPKYYVATNAAEGTAVTLTVTGVPGTLVNLSGFEKTFTASVDKTRLAVFEKITDEGKPLWGEFNLKATVEGAEPAEIKGKFIGSKGPAYQKRLKEFKDRVQGEYDKETDELRQFITTLKAEQADASRLVKEYKDGWATPVNRTKITADWTAYTSKAGNFLGAIEQKLKDRLGGADQPKHHARAFQDVSTTVGQLQQLIKAHGERLSGAQPSANPDELDGLVQAGVLALETWLGSAVSRSPFEAGRPADTKSPPPAATTTPAPAPATTAASTSTSTSTSTAAETVPAATSTATTTTPPAATSTATTTTPPAAPASP